MSDTGKAGGSPGLVPPGVLDTAAVIQHEMVASYERAGFSRAEAMQILIAIITVTGPGAAAPPPKG